MKRVIIIFVLVLTSLCLLTSCTYTKVTKTETKVISCNQGETLYVDVKVQSGAINIKVTAPDGKIYFEKELSKSYNYGINIYISDDYTVTEQWQNARGNVTIYQTATIENSFKNKLLDK